MSQTVVQPYTLHRAKDEDSDTCADLLGTALVYRGPQVIRDLINHNGLVIMAKRGHDLIAVGVAQVVPDLRDILPPGNGTLATRFPSNGPIGVVKQLVTTPAARGAGIATALVAAHIEWMQTQGLNIAMSDAWVYPDGTVPAASPLLANGFNCLERVVGFWREDSLTPGNECTVDGSPCNCSADIFVRRFTR